MAPARTKATRTIAPVGKPIRKQEPLEGEKSGQLEVVVQVQRYANYEACSRLDVDIKRKVGKEGKKNIGGMVAFLVDKTILNQTDKKGAWIEELFEHGERLDEDQTKELRFLTKEMLFTPTGRVKRVLGAFNEQLSADKLVFIDGFRIFEKYRQKGSGRQPMRMFLEMIPEIVGRDHSLDQLTATCFLSPARDSNTKIDNGKTDVQVEEGLKRAYGANGYEVWIQGDPNVKDSVTIMGRSV